MNMTPEWLRKASIYQVYPRTFSKEGTIKAVTKELPFIASLGFRIIYLCPVFEADDSEDRTFWSERQLASETNNPKNPYRMKDYFKIDPEYGTMEDLRELVEETHRLGMKILLDLVYFHLGPGAPILKAHPDFTTTDENGNIVTGKWHFPAFNFDNPGVREYLWGNMVYYIAALGVDGYRCDVAGRVPLDFWAEGKRRIQAINPEAIMINEGSKAEYLAVFDMNYGMHWNSIVHKLLLKEITCVEFMDTHRDFAERYPENALIMRNMENHDLVTNRPYRIDEHFGSDCMELTMALNYTIDGVPMVYCGNEICDTARHSMFANRFFMGAFEVADREDLKPTAAAARRMEVCKILNRMKQEWAPLSNGKTQWLQTENPYVLAFTRTWEDQVITFVGNFSADEADLTLDLSGEVLLSNQAKENHFGAYGYCIVKK